MKKTLLLCPIPPPYAGPEVASEILIDNLPELEQKYVHMKSNLRDENWKKGKFDLEGLLEFSKLIKRLIFRLSGNEISKIYLLLSSSRVGFLRDSFYILLSYFLRKKIIVHYRGGNFDGFFGKCSLPMKKFITFILDRCNLIIVQAEILRKMFDGITSTRTVMLYNGLVNENDQIRKTFNSECINLLFLGHIAFSKGFYELINAYKNLYKDYGLKLFFAGTFRFEGKKSKTQKGFLKGEVLEYYNRNSEKISKEIKDFVENAERYNAKYLGIISGSEKERVFNESDILVLPSYTEGFSVTVLEALSKGLPVLVSKVGALPEIIQEDVNGWLVDPGNDTDLIEKIKAAVSSRNRFTDISFNNIIKFRKNFDIKEIALQFDRILQNV